jgi:hypothetical protein
MKIVVLGPFNSGKSSLIKKICRGSSISLDKSGTTVSLDHGTTSVYGIQIHLFGTPGLARFEIIRKILQKGADGIIFVLDSLNPATFDEAKGLWKGFRENLSKDVPAIILANKQDIPEAMGPAEVFAGLDLQNETNIPIIGVSAKEGTNIEKALSLIVLSVLSRYFNILKAIRDGETISGISNILRTAPLSLKFEEKDLITLLQWLAWRGLITGNFEAQKFSLPGRIKEIVEIFEFIKNFTPKVLENHPLPL